MLLAHATPTVDDGVLRLQFARADIADAWRDSGAQATLDAALKHCRLQMAVEVGVADTALA
jgi:hypothetical protein